MIHPHTTLLIEIGTEELPPLALRRLSEAFGKEIAASLENARLSHGEVVCFATPRRLAVSITKTQTRQAEKEKTRRGPSLRAALDADGNPTKAALGFARSCGVAVAELEQLTTEEGSWLVFREIETGHPTVSLLPVMVSEALSRLPIPKRMRWADKEVEFVRPVHWVVLLLGDQVVEVEIMGVTSGRSTRGHRFHHPEPLVIESPDDYAELLYREGKVVADLDARKEMIRAQVEEAARSVDGEAVITDELLEEVTALVEWPMAIVGGFDREFLELPSRVLTGTMIGHQKYFPVANRQGDLMPNFITISNIESRNPDTVRRGNERVIRPRLADAAFFFAADLRRPLADRLDDLKSVVFQKKLGSLFDKSQRVAGLAEWIANALRTTVSEDSTGGDEEATLARRAGLLCKCDLMTQMVGELPELQGYMGRVYGERTGEDKATAIALEEVYWPRFAGDAIPATRIGRITALADKLDTLVGIFGIGQIPKGDRDPFALRRAALGTLRILIEGALSLSLPALLDAAAQGYGDLFDAREVTPRVHDFMLERLRGYFADQGFEPDIFAAVVARTPDRSLDFAHRMHAVAAFRELPEAASLASANKRIRNILKKAAPTDAPVADSQSFGEVNEALLQEDAERRLASHVAELMPKVMDLLSRRDYTSAMTTLAALKNRVDAFFDTVLVMAEDEQVKDNRLALLRNIHALFSEIADISYLSTNS
uniref:Glycine--tRNA ligase beta subunit n=1 Tax=Candidatus Kentrum sp. MB TaxID=2138164 RepID=A0A450XK28_9GAMM|nr:MAG: glycyl-tRNA synthetase beta chain [Candidatus Kentron sp. MB]VFK33733.1 MAG: glycyl-tRNA synthetase beta chain [Candidatus Kentron sp. MB]VFK76327.1 MAG: glycyl-tRNA synthetase beta chain [Candidatus Kentron sp. MB]